MGAGELETTATTDPATTDPPEGGGEGTGEGTGEGEGTGKAAGEKQSGGEKTTDGGKKTALGKDEGDAGKKADGAPEKYELQFAEGAEPDPVALAMFEKTARTMGLSNESAQQLVELYDNLQEQSINDNTEAWGKAAAKDEEFGGANYEGNIKRALGVVQKYGSEEFSHLLDATGLGNHPEVIRVFHRIAKAMGEDTAGGTGPGAGKLTPEQARDQALRERYPTMFKDGSAA